MRVVVVGGSGNAGSALLRALAEEDAVTSVLGVARRFPDRSAPPYDRARWATFDVGAEAPGPGGEQRLVAGLAELLAGADAVVHLAWLVQPNRDRALLRRTNVDGTRRVAQACVRAGVGHLVVASSVGAYSPVDDDVPRDETWPTGGVRTSHYSVDKAAQEDVLDEVERDQGTTGDLVVTRLRPSLIFQGDAGEEVARYFLGPLFPRALAGPGRLPVLPLPAGLRFQATHADDVARAYVAALTHRDAARGAFNVAGEPVLRVADIAAVLDHGRSVALPPALVRRFLALAWGAHAVPADPGWIDMAMGAPLMDTTRIRERLGWTPRRDAVDTLRELLDGIARRRGIPSPPMAGAETGGSR